MATRGRKIPTKLLKKPAAKNAPTAPKTAPVAAPARNTGAETTREESQQVALDRISKVVFEDKEVPEEVTQLIEYIVIEDSEIIWELKSFIDANGTIIDPKGMRDFIVAVIDERKKNYPEPGQRLAVEDSLVFLSPALYKAQLNEEKRDSLLLRKATAVRGVYKCPKPTCGDDLISTVQVQNRSFDEPSTNIHSCLICGTTWTSV